SGGGRARGPRLHAKGGRGVRPTSSKVTGALFNSLAPRLAGARVLDLFAGTGRVGIEALSRGASEAVFVERDPRNAALIRETLVAAGARAEVRRANALTEVQALDAQGRRFDLIFLDPPYGLGLQAQTLRRIAAGAVLADDGLAIAEGHWRDDPGEVAGLARIRAVRYGETALWVYARPPKREEGP
ncbi:MAG TPA: 16S rRNA (guanine(966)-N(2))-methyltransferase RsmD, partial [bacterium]|nr:16S rRNA (guanine(966)-N(2))-methyltransferase RsmD [bacterium]